jgi:hypothetical protein
MLLTNTRYTEITGQAAPANFASVQGRVVSRLEGMLNRELQSAERTEKVTLTWDGFHYPKATPVTAVEDGLHFDDIAIRAGRDTEQITYTGGYTSETLPAGLAESIAWGIHTLTAAAQAGGPPSPIPPGIKSLSIAGEYAVTFQDGHTAGSDGYPLPDRWTHMADLGGRSVTAALRYRRVPL